MEKNFDYFQIQKWMLQTVRPEKEDEKKWGHLSSFHVSWVMVLNLSKKVDFLQFCADLSKKLKPVQPIYILKVLTTLFQKMIWFIGFWATVHEILAIKISKEILSDPGEINKMHLFDNLRTTTQKGNLEARQMTPFFSSTFSTLTVFKFKFISEFENTQN